MLLFWFTVHDSVTFMHVFYVKFDWKIYKDSAKPCESSIWAIIVSILFQSDVFGRNSKYLLKIHNILKYASYQEIHDIFENLIYVTIFSTQKIVKTLAAHLKHNNYFEYETNFRNQNHA